MGRNLTVLNIKGLPSTTFVSKSGAGFTLIELLVSFAVILLLSGLALTNWKGGSQNLALVRAASLVAQDIQKAQEFSLSGKSAACFASAPSGSILGYGIFLSVSSPDSYIIFANCNSQATFEAGTDQIVETKTLEQGITVFSISPSPLSILFVPPAPDVKIEPGNALLGDVVLQNNQGKQKTLRVNTKGVIDIL